MEKVGQEVAMHPKTEDDLGIPRPSPWRNSETTQAGMNAEQLRQCNSWRGLVQDPLREPAATAILCCAQVWCTGFNLMPVSILARAAKIALI